MSGQNANPTIFAVASATRTADELALEDDLDARDPLDALEVFEMIRTIQARSSP